MSFFRTSQTTQNSLVIGREQHFYLDEERKNTIYCRTKKGAASMQEFISYAKFESFRSKISKMTVTNCAKATS